MFKKLLKSYKKPFKQFIALAASQTFMLLFFVIASFLIFKFFSIDLIRIGEKNKLFFLGAIILYFVGTVRTAEYVYHFYE